MGTAIAVMVLVLLAVGYSGQSAPSAQKVAEKTT